MVDGPAKDARRTPRKPPELHVLELRIHGIGNTPPQGMLGVGGDKVVRTRGDELASFWETTDQQSAEQGTVDGTDPRTPGRRHVEAYSWGALARASALPGLGFVAGLGQALIRAGWTMLIPLGVANAAYWARRLPEDMHVGVGRQGAAPKLRPAAPFGAAAVRLFCLALTLLLVGTFTTTSVDLVGTQCFGPLTSTTAGTAPDATVTVSRLVCSHLPGAVRGMASMSDGQRIALLALVPVAFLVLLVLVSWSGRVRFDQRVSVTRAMRGGTGEGKPWRGVPVLARTGFWRTASQSGTDASLHVAAGFALVAAFVVWQRRAAPSNLGQLGNPVLWSVLFVLAVVVLAGSAMRVVAVTSGYPDVDGDEPSPLPAWLSRLPKPPVSRVLLGVSIGVLLVVLGLLAASGDYLPGGGASGVAPVSFASDALATALVIALVLLALVGVGLRRGVQGWVWMWLGGAIVVAGFGCAVLGRLSRVQARASAGSGGAAYAGAVICAVVVAVALILLVREVLAAAADRDERRFTGWAGTAPAVFMTISAGLAMLLSSLVVVGVAALLDTPVTSTCVQVCTAGSPGAALATPRSAQDLVTGTHHVLAVPTVFTFFGIATVGVLIGLVVIAAFVVWRGLSAGAIPVRPGGSYLGVDQLAEAGREAILGARRTAAMAQRAELAVGGLAALFAAALGYAVVRSLVVDVSDTFQQGPGCRAVCDNISIRTIVAALITGVAATVAGNMLAGSRKAAVRPWGLLWDLQCFLPRAAHPFGPPCYSERVVPELRRRIDDWLERPSTAPGGTREQDPDKRVVVSAHSMGVVLAVAALLARWDDQEHRIEGRRVVPWADDRISLLTYGTQLRPYFGRFFPELLGPAVTGTRPSPRPRFWAADPWEADRDVPVVADRGPLDATGAAPGALTLVESLGGRAAPRWISLWRRTDFAGFPVDAYTIGPPRDAEEPQPPETVDAPRAIDRMAGEYDERAYMFVAARHSGYPDSAAYERAMEDLGG